MTARAFTVEQRRARIGRRHALSNRLGDVAAVADAMVVLHATDPASIFLSAAARQTDPSVESVSTALYEDRTVVRQLAMRRTLFVVSLAVLDLIEASSSVAVAKNERKRLETFLSDSGIDDPASWLTEAAAEIAEAMPDDGAPARTLTDLVPRLATRITMGSGKHVAEAGATSRVLGVLAAEGRLMRGKPAGAWTGRQYRWHTREQWLGQTGPAALHAAEASAALVQRWLTTFGPATYQDLKWWTGWTAKQTRAALADVGAVEVDLHGGPGLVLPDDLDDPMPGDPWVALLPSLDPTPMGWKARDWYLGGMEAELFDRNGNVGPTIWADGRVVGGWGQRPDGSVAPGLLDDIGADHRDLLETEVERLNKVLGGTVIKPSFPTPLQKRLSA